MEFNKVSKGIYEPIEENKKKFEENFKDKLSEIFPSLVKDGQVDFKALLEELGEYVDTKERYELNWSGKQNAKKKANEDIVGRTLKYVEADSKNPETTENLYIEGDNLEVLKLLRNSYYNKVKMIYIDPPYNTGNDFVYNDNFSQSEKENEIEEGDILDNERLTINQKSNGKYHSNWLNMMYPRLKIAKDLLTEDGVIFISIDDNEVDNLKKICNEVFREENFIAQIVWKRRSNTPNDRFIGKIHEYVVVYAKNIQSVILYLQLRNAEIDEKYKNPNNDPRGAWFADNLSANGKGGRLVASCVFSIKNPYDGKDYYPPQNKCWLYNKEKMDMLINEDRIGFRENSGNPYLKRFLSEVRQGSTLPTIILDGGVSVDSAKEIRALFKTDVFEFPKPTSLIKKFLISGTSNKDLILDFFSGSSTTAHAVMQLNAEDGGNRKFIMVQIPEPCDEKSEAYKAGYKNICEIGKERIRRAEDKIIENEKLKIENSEKENNSQLSTLNSQLPDVGFKVFKTADTNIRWFSEAIKTGGLLPIEEETTDKDKLDFNDGFTDIDVVYEILLRHRDIPLSAKVENLKEIGKRTYMFADAVVVCLEKEITEEIVDKIARLEPMPIKIIFRDSAFGDDISLKENTMIRLEAQIKKNSGLKKKAYRIEFI